MKKITIYLLLFFLLSSLVYAVAPITSVTSFVGDVGIQIEMNNMEYYKLGEERWNIIYAFNLSNGMILNSTNSNVVCINHLRNSQGFEVGQQTAIRSGKYFYLNGSSGKNNPVGIYTYTINCQDINAGLGGYKSGFFEITESGRAESVTPLLSFILLIFLIIAFLLYLVKNFSADIFEENGALKIFFVLLSFWLLLLPFYVFILFNEYFGIFALSTLLWKIWPYLIWINIGLTFYFMIYFIIKLIKSISDYVR